MIDKSPINAEFTVIKGPDVNIVPAKSDDGAWASSEEIAAHVTNWIVGAIVLVGAAVVGPILHRFIAGLFPQ